MTSKEWTEYWKEFPGENFRSSGKMLADLAALESFCAGLSGVNDDLRGKLTACEQWNRALLAEAREEGKPPPPEEVIARLTFNNDGEEIGREMGKRIMNALRHDYQWLYTTLNPDAPPASAGTEGTGLSEDAIAAILGRYLQLSMDNHAEYQTSKHHAGKWDDCTEIGCNNDRYLIGRLRSATPPAPKRNKRADVQECNFCGAAWLIGEVERHWYGCNRPVVVEGGKD